jgi:hypothetical protein
MSDETGDERFEDLDNPAWPGTDDGGMVGIEGIRDDLLAAMEEVGLVPGTTGEAGSAAAGCYLSTGPVDREGVEGIVVRWQRRDPPVPGEPAPAREVESVDILNEALGPLLLALGFPIEPYAVDGGWIVTGPRS